MILTTKNVRQFTISSPMTEVKNGPREEILKIDKRLLEAHERIVEGSKGVVRSKRRSTNCNIVHRLASKAMPTDVYHRGKRVRETERD